jgi:DNA-binding NarL/FixJ family response regulator
MIDQSSDSFHPSTDGLGPIVVLLVDDQKFVGMAVRQLVSSDPEIELHCCLLAAEAVATANRIAPAVVLQDLVMPDGDGLAMVALFRANPVTAATPVVVLSGNEGAAARTRALAAGAAEYVVKLPASADLIACIRRHAGRESREPVIDPATMATFCEAGSPGFTRRVIDQFILEAESRVRLLSDAAASGDRAALTAGAHSLKGSSLIMGARRLAALCVQLEDQLAGGPDCAIAPALMVNIDQELGQVRDALVAQRPGGDLQ